MEQRLKDKLQALANEVVQTLIEKDDLYGSSWKSHEGFSAFFNTQRKWSRIEKMSADNGYDIFAAVRSSPEGEDAMKDLIGYALLTLSETHILDHDLLVRQFLVSGCGDASVYTKCGKVALCENCWSVGNEDAAHIIETRAMEEEARHARLPEGGKVQDDGAGPDYVNQD